MKKGTYIIEGTNIKVTVGSKKKNLEEGLFGKKHPKTYNRVEVISDAIGMEPSFIKPGKTGLIVMFGQGYTQEEDEQQVISSLQASLDRTGNKDIKARLVDPIGGKVGFVVPYRD